MKTLKIAVVACVLGLSMTAVPAKQASAMSYTGCQAFVMQHFLNNWDYWGNWAYFNGGIQALNLVRDAVCAPYHS